MSLCFSDLLPFSLKPPYPQLALPLLCRVREPFGRCFLKIFKSPFVFILREYLFYIKEGVHGGADVMYRNLYGAFENEYVICADFARFCLSCLKLII